VPVVQALVKPAGLRSFVDDLTSLSAFLDHPILSVELRLLDVVNIRQTDSMHAWVHVFQVKYMCALILSVYIILYIEYTALYVIYMNTNDYIQHTVSIL
jgi:hypothetical protein